MGKIIELIKKNKKDIVKPVTVLLVICLIIPLALSLTNKLTADKITALEAKNQNEAMNRLISAEKFTMNRYMDEFNYYIAKENHKIIGFIFITQNKGYGGTVSVMTALNMDGTVKAVDILDVSTETPGLGQNAAKESFYSQYSNKKKGVSLLKNGADKNKNEVDAVTGATITSTAVNKCVNAALANYDKVINLDISADDKWGDGE